MDDRHAPSDLNEDRWHDLLKAFGDLNRDFQAFRSELMAEQLTYWHATAEALRVLSDWWARETDKDRHDRAERQSQLDRQLAAIHAFEHGSQQDRQHMRMVLTVLIVVEVVLLVIVMILVVIHL